MEIEYYTQKFLYNIQDSKLINRNSELNFTLGMKSCHFNKKQTKQKFEEWGQNALKITMFYKKINDN
jgi:hypothetical protein